MATSKSTMCRNGIHLKKILDKVQRRVTKMANLSYEESLQYCELTILERRRERGDLIET